jgi:glycosyltransferase involved in cell wall biosynthesis
MMMEIVLSTLGKFHTFDLARELHARGSLRAVFSGYPRLKLREERLPPELVRTFPWLHAPYVGAIAHGRFVGGRARRLWEYLDRVTLDRYVSAHMPSCDLFVGLSSSALRSGRAAHAQGAKYVCDRGSAHIRVQDQLLREEHALWGLPYDGIDPRVLDLEEREYAEADCITVPSNFAMRSFTGAGVATEKLRRLPYGVDVSRFEQTARPDPERFDIVFVGIMSLRKGVQYLTEAYGKIVHRAKSLSFVGPASAELIDLLKRRARWYPETRVMGPVAQSELKHLLSKSHVLVLPSIEDGFGMVLAQAMACGCPVIGTHHTGTEDLLGPKGGEGFVVPVRDSDALAQRLQQLADDPELRSGMGAAALARVKQLGGWSTYGGEAMAIYEALVSGRVIGSVRERANL